MKLWGPLPIYNMNKPTERAGIPKRADSQRRKGRGKPRAFQPLGVGGDPAKWTEKKQPERQEGNQVPSGGAEPSLQVSGV